MKHRKSERLKKRHQAFGVIVAQVGEIYFHLLYIQIYLGGVYKPESKPNQISIELKGERGKAGVANGGLNTGNGQMHGLYITFLTILLMKVEIVADNPESQRIFE
ncbi:hypothetical protein [Arundinibacter roseus]|uniref:Uncharacterized protein n=1 Tax=Arundinibacter roseus TaxID=2070510 RepID=A0A4R4KGT7_9BACT|nr:hypothetical protein [Arundinibacter roseus]TDB65791.1 hypothetical protein EZE20_08465 [Arundinibacter roseus]